MKIACVIPARLKSTRFPKKILADLAGKPLIQRVWEAAAAVPLFDSVTCAIDDPETAAVIESFGGTYQMTSVDCPTGTMRLCELAHAGKIDADIVVCWQGDEPFIHTAMIEDLLQTSHTDGADVWTLKKRLRSPQDVASSHVVKVVTDAKGFALYFSRSPIPFYRDEADDAAKVYYKHVGIYAYTMEMLKKASSLPPTPLESAEVLEQLPFLYHGFKVRVHETAHEVRGIDIPEHLAQAEILLNQFLGTATKYS